MCDDKELGPLEQSLSKSQSILNSGSATSIMARILEQSLSDCQSILNTALDYARKLEASRRYWRDKYMTAEQELKQVRASRDELCKDEPPDRQVYQSLRSGGRLIEVKADESVIEAPEGLIVGPHGEPPPLIVELKAWRQAALEARILVQQIYDRDWMKSAQPWHLIAEKHPWLREHELGEELEGGG